MNHYHLPVWESITTAWHKVHGSKGTIWAAVGIIILTLIGIAVLQGIAHTFSRGLASIIYFIGQVIVFLMQMGLFYIGILRAREIPINYRLMYRAFNWEIGLKVIGTYIAVMVVFLIPTLLMILAFALQHNAGISAILAVVLYVAVFIYIIYFAIRLFLALGFALDKKANPIDAIKLSFRATRCNFWRLIAILFLQFIIITISAIPLGLGLIWTLPFMYNLYGTIYNRLTQASAQVIQ